MASYNLVSHLFLASMKKNYINKKKSSVEMPWILIGQKYTITLFPRTLYFNQTLTLSKGEPSEFEKDREMTRKFFHIIEQQVHWYRLPDAKMKKENKLFYGIY